MSDAFLVCYACYVCMLCCLYSTPRKIEQEEKRKKRRQVVFAVHERLVVSSNSNLQSVSQEREEKRRREKRRDTDHEKSEVELNVQLITMKRQVFCVFSSPLLVLFCACCVRFIIYRGAFEMGGHRASNILKETSEKKNEQVNE